MSAFDSSSPADQAKRRRRRLSLAILQLRISPWANVFIDNESLGANSRLVDTLTAGRHVRRFERDGFMPKDTTSVLQAGQGLRINIRLTPRNQQ